MTGRVVAACLAIMTAGAALVWLAVVELRPVFYVPRPYACLQWHSRFVATLILGDGPAYLTVAKYATCDVPEDDPKGPTPDDAPSSVGVY